MFWVTYVLFVAVAAGGPMATAQIGPIAKDYGLAKLPMSLLGTTWPLLTLTLAIDNLPTGSRVRCADSSATGFYVGEPQARVQLCFENSILGNEIFIPKQECLVYHSGDVGQDTTPIHGHLLTRLLDDEQDCMPQRKSQTTRDEGYDAGMKLLSFKPVALLTSRDRGSPNLSTRLRRHEELAKD